MPHTKCRASFSRRAGKVRNIAKGIFDKTERRIVLKFVADAEKLAGAASPRAVLSVLSLDAASAPPSVRPAP
jgi:hypothetical protein